MPLSGLPPLHSLFLSTATSVRIREPLTQNASPSGRKVVTKSWPQGKETSLSLQPLQQWDCRCQGPVLPQLLLNPQGLMDLKSHSPLSPGTEYRTEMLGAVLPAGARCEGMWMGV